MESVGFQSNGMGPVGMIGTELLRSSAQHSMSEVGREDRTCSEGTMLEESQCEITGAAADVEDCGFRLHEGGMKCERGPTPPEPVDIRREDVIEKIVSRRDSVEHLLHSLGGVGLILDTDRLGA